MEVGADGAAPIPPGLRGWRLGKDLNGATEPRPVLLLGHTLPWQPWVWHLPDSNPTLRL